MDEKKATEIYEYLEENWQESMGDISEGLGITIDEAMSYVATFHSRARGEFIYLLTKTK